MIERKILTCPETGRLENVELDSTPLGLIVVGCSRQRDNDLACSRECTRRMDRRDQVDAQNRERVVVIVSSLHNDAGRIASALADSLAGDRLAVEIAELGARSMPPLEDYDAVVIGAEVRLGRHERAAIDYIRAHRDALIAMPAFFFSVGGRAVFDRDGDVLRMIRRTGWRPALAATFADASAVQPHDIRGFARQIGDEIPASPSLSPG